jgi:tetratricopeptide (TPR) repeat protein
MTPIRILNIALILIGISHVAAAPRKSSTPKPAPSIEAARLNNLGVAYMNQQLFEKGLKSFEEAAAHDPKLLVASLNRGIALLNLQRLDAAKEFLSAATRRDPRDPHGWYNLGLLEKNSGNPEAAAKAFKRVTEIDAGDADTWYMLGTAYVQVKQFAPAIEAFERALKLNPLHASAEFGLSRALQQSGDTAKAREHIARFQYITQNKLGVAMSLAYGEQGQYSRAEESPAAPGHVPPAIKVRFVDVTAEAGLSSKLLDEPAGLAFQDSGACFLDYDGDGLPDLLITDHGPNTGLTLYHNLGHEKFEDVTRKAGLPLVHGISCAAGDYDNDGATDFAITTSSSDHPLILFHNQKNGTFKDVTQEAGIKLKGSALAVNFIDYDHDGDLDLYVVDAETCALDSPTECVGRNSLWRNNGNGTFTDVTETTGLAGPPGPHSSVATDYNNDRAVDILVTSKVAPQIYENPREGKFRPQAPWAKPMPAPTTGVAVLDFDHDGWMDVAFTHAGAPGITLWRNNHGKSFEPVTLPDVGWLRGFGVTALDYDNDGWIDLAAVGETKEGRGEIRLFRNLGPDGFKDVTAEVGLDKITLRNPRALISGDYDGDGATDLLVTQNHGPAVLLRNEGGNQNHWMRLSLKGLNDNKSALGTKVEVFAGGNRQKWEIEGSSGYLGQNSTDILVGLGEAQEADVVRMLWPTGVLQDEIEVAGNRTQSYTEIDRRGSSCPTLFVWDGERYQFVADMLGAGVVGHWVGPGERNIPRPTEYIKVPRNAMREKNGRLSFRFMEPLEEVVYLDQVELLAVDHPSDVDVYPNEYFASNPPYPQFKVVLSRDARPPAGAWDEHGHNVLPDLLAHHFFGDFEVLPFAGFARPHTLELELGERYNRGPLWLLLHGEIEYFSATSMYAADQAGLKPIAPYIEALDEKGNWVRVVDDMGFPAGGARTMTADLTGKLPQGTQRIRITSNLQVYWDSILIDRTVQEQKVVRTSVPLARADLRFHGFPLKIEGQPPGNVSYVYEKASATGPYTRPAGAYTRYGDVLPLLSGFDDRLVVFGSGDEVALDFDPAKLPALSQGWTRDYFFVAHGYEKDMDFYAFDGDRVDPLPFQNMGTYPYSRKQYPLDDQHLRDLLEYNTRYMSGSEQPGYNFDYKSRQ